MKKLLRKLKSLWSRLCQGLKDWVFVPGRGIAIVALYLLLAIIAFVVVVCMAIGCVGSLILAVLSIPALLLMLGFNWVVPVFGGPEITFKVAVGLVFLAIIAIGVLKALKE